jgi:hypothetical protein
MQVRAFEHGVEVVTERFVGQVGADVNELHLLKI